MEFLGVKYGAILTRWMNIDWAEVIHLLLTLNFHLCELFIWKASGANL
jgi:hypothetical protein